MKLVIPYRSSVFHTPLSEADIQAAVRKHAHLGQWDGMFFKSKPYFGEVSAGHFEIRPCGRLKKYGYGPALSVLIAPQSAGAVLKVTVKPHMLLLGLAILLLAPCAIFLLLHVLAFFRTWDITPVVNFASGTATIAACFVLPYQISASRSLQFWQQELLLGVESGKN